MAAPLASRALAGAVALFLGTFAAASGVRAAVAVDLELVLAIDVSGSVDYEEGRLQRQGYVAAIVDPKVVAAIRSGILGRIAVSYFEWSGEARQRLVVDWTLIDGERSARAFAVKLFNAPLVIGRFTSLSGAIGAAFALFAASDFEGTRRVIDISGDGPNNAGGLVTGARDAARAAGIIINGLPIINDRPNILGYPNLPDLDFYYRDCVIGGPGAFIVLARDRTAFAAAIRRKMILEIAARPRLDRPPVRHSVAAAVPTAAGAMPCDIGERQFLQFLRQRGEEF